MSSSRGKRSLSRSQHQVTIDSDEDNDQSSRPTASSHSNKVNRSSSSSSGSSNMNTVTTHHSLTSLFVPEVKVQRAEVVIKEKEIQRFNGLSVDAQNLCVKTVVRLFLMKGSRREVIHKKTVTDQLDKIDSEYKKHANMVISIAQDQLDQLFGYTLVCGSDLPDGKQDDYYLTSNLLIKPLLEQLQQHQTERDTSYYGFMIVILFSILFAPAQKSSCKDLLADVRLLDPRFPSLLSNTKSSSNSNSSSSSSSSAVDKETQSELQDDVDPTANAKGSKGSLAVPELHDDFMGLLNRMRKEQYVSVTKDEVDPTDFSKDVYSFGVRFFLDIGKKQLILAYYSMVGKEVDEKYLAEIEKGNMRNTPNQG